MFDNYSPPPVLVLGVGNILLSDEGVGIRVIEQLQRDYHFPENIELIDGGTLGHGLIDVLRGRQRVLVIDAVKTDGPPGAIYRFSGKDLAPARGNLNSVHDIGVSEALFFLSLKEELPPDIEFYGIQPKSLTPSLELSPEVSAAAQKVVAMIIKDLSNV